MPSLLSLPNELLIDIAKRTANLETTICLRLTCKHLNAIFEANRNTIMTRHREQLINPYIEYLVFASLPGLDYVEFPSPSWSVESQAHSAFALEVMRHLPYIHQRMPDEGNNIAPGAYAIDWRPFFRFYQPVYDLQHSLEVIRHRASAPQHLVQLTTGAHIFMDVMRAEMYLVGSSFLVMGCEDFWQWLRSIVLESGLQDPPASCGLWWVLYMHRRPWPA